jgi:hypothetical protein
MVGAIHVGPPVRLIIWGPLKPALFNFFCL